VPAAHRSRGSHKPWGRARELHQGLPNTFAELGGFGLLDGKPCPFEIETPTGAVAHLVGLGVGVALAFGW